MSFWERFTCLKYQLRLSRLSLPPDVPLPRKGCFKEVIFSHETALLAAHAFNASQSAH